MVKADSHRILRNTGALYVRMLLVMAVSLYISRVVLAALGVDDYGIYNVVGGIVVFFSFLTGALSLSIQRFLAADLGRGDLQAARRTFSVSLQVHAVLAVVLLLAAETLGVWFLTTQLNIPAGRMAAAGRVFQFTLLSFVAKLFVVPFNAAVIAHERMSFYAYLSLLEAALNLAAAGLLTLCRGDRLVLYAGLVSAVNLVVLGAYVLFCRSRYDCCRPAPVRDRALFRRILSFSGWNTLGGAANVCVQQGLNFLLNIFCGVAVNAAWAVTGQVTAGVTSLVGSFQTAANPQIVKTCPGGVRSGFFALVLQTSRLSYFLVLLFALPMLFCTPFVLRLWLVEPPAYSVPFIRLMLLFSLVEALAGPLWMGIQAQGDIRRYQQVLGGVVLLNLPLAWLLLRAGCPPQAVVALRVAVNVAALGVRLDFFARRTGFSRRRYLRDVLRPAAAVTLLAVPLPLLVSLATQGWTQLLATTAVSTLSLALCLPAAGLLPCERRLLLRTLKKHFGCHA